MKKINTIKKNEEFARIIKENKFIKTNSYIIYIEEKKQKLYHFGISVSKKIGNAVTRNRVKRQIKNIIDKKDYKNNFNCIIIVRKNFLNNSFAVNSNQLYEVLKTLNIYQEEKNEK